MASSRGRIASSHPSSGVIFAAAKSSIINEPMADPDASRTSRYPTAEAVALEAGRRRGNPARVIQGAKRSNCGDVAKLAYRCAYFSEWGSEGRELKSHRPDHFS